MLFLFFVRRASPPRTPLFFGGVRSPAVCCPRPKAVRLFQAGRLPVSVFPFPLPPSPVAEAGECGNLSTTMGRRDRGYFFLEKATGFIPSHLRSIVRTLMSPHTPDGPEGRSPRDGVCYVILLCAPANDGVIFLRMSQPVLLCSFPPPFPHLRSFPSIKRLGHGSTGVFHRARSGFGCRSVPSHRPVTVCPQAGDVLLFLRTFF